MFKKYKIITLGLALSSLLSFDTVAITPKELALATTGVGIATTLIADNQLKLDTKYSLTTGFLAGVAAGAALIKKDCHTYKKLVDQAALNIKNIEGHKLLRDKSVIDGLAKTGYDDLVLRSRVRDLYQGSKSPFRDANFSLIDPRYETYRCLSDMEKAKKLFNCEQSFAKCLETYRIFGRFNNTSSADILHVRAQNLLSNIYLQEDILDRAIVSEKRAANRRILE